MKQLQLFDTSNLKPGENYVSPSDKRKWTIAFNKWCIEQLIKYGHCNGMFHCGGMFICDYCESNKQSGCKSCVETIKTIYLNKFGEIPYKNYDFKAIFEKVEREANSIKK